MAGIKVTIVYYSATGITHKMAEAVMEGALAEGAEVRLRKVQELAPESVIAQNAAWKAHREATADVQIASHDDLDWADAIILGTPARFGGMASQLKQFIDTTGGLWAQGKLTNKVVSSFATADNPHGGQESTILALNNIFYHWGAIIAPPGYTDQVVFAAGGNPYGASAARVGGGPTEEELEGAQYLGKRVATVARWLAVGRS